MNSEHPSHTLHAVDSGLERLHQLLLGMMQAINNQFLTAMSAVEATDPAQAVLAIQFDAQILQLDLEIDSEALTALARYSPVADDLRRVLASLKIAKELQGMDYELLGFARLAAKVFDNGSSSPNELILADMIKSGSLVKRMLSQSLLALQTQDSAAVYPLLDIQTECDENLREGIKHQLVAALRETRKIKCTLDLLQMTKALQHCSGHCKNLAEYLIYMLDGVDVRHLVEAELIRR
jgi:phosphate transport system protein